MEPKELKSIVSEKKQKEQTQELSQFYPMWITHPDPTHPNHKKPLLVRDHRAHGAAIGKTVNEHGEIVADHPETIDTDPPPADPPPADPPLLTEAQDKSSEDALLASDPDMKYKRKKA